MECKVRIIAGILIFSFSTVLIAENSLNGFKNIKWGESITKHKEVMHLTSENKKIKKYYTIDNDDMLLGDIKLTSISYVFYKDKFSSLILQTGRSSDNLKKTLSFLKNKFGNPSYANKYINKFRWENESTIVDLKCFASSHKCSLIYNSVTMSKLEQSDIDAMANN
jgi:hypothetical protein